MAVSLYFRNGINIMHFIANTRLVKNKLSDYLRKPGSEIIPNHVFLAICYAKKINSLESNVTYTDKDVQENSYWSCFTNRLSKSSFPNRTTIYLLCVNLTLDLTAVISDVTFLCRQRIVKNFS